MEEHQPPHDSTGMMTAAPKVLRKTGGGPVDRRLLEVGEQNADLLEAKELEIKASGIKWWVGKQAPGFETHYYRKMVKSRGMLKRWGWEGAYLDVYDGFDILSAPMSIWEIEGLEPDVCPMTCCDKCHKRGHTTEMCDKRQKCERSKVTKRRGGHKRQRREGEEIVWMKDILRWKQQAEAEYEDLLVGHVTVRRGGAYKPEEDWRDEVETWQLEAVGTEPEEHQDKDETNVAIVDKFAFVTIRKKRCVRDRRFAFVTVRKKVKRR